MIIDIPTTAALRTTLYGLRMITDLGPTRIGVSPDKVWFQGSSRSAETYKATPLFCAKNGPKTHTISIHQYYLGATVSFFRATGHIVRPSIPTLLKQSSPGKGCLSSWILLSSDILRSSYVQTMANAAATGVGTGTPLFASGPLEETGRAW